MRLKYTNRLLYLEERIRFYTKETHSLVIKGQNGAARILARDLCRLDILCKQTKEFLLKFDDIDDTGLMEFDKGYGRIPPTIHEEEIDRIIEEIGTAQT